MRIVVSLLVVIALIGAAMGDETGDPADRLVCPFPVEELPELRQELYGRAEECTEDTIQNSTGVDVRLRRNGTIEYFSTLFHTKCAHLSVYSQCWEDESRVANACLDAIGVTKFRLLRQSKELFMQIGCVDNGENAAKMFHARLNGAQFHYDCTTNALSELVKPSTDDQNPNADILYDYKLVNKLTECKEGLGRGGEYDAVLNIEIAFGTQLLDRMKCVKDGADVLCKTLVDNN